MKKLFVLAALLMANTAAHAGDAYSFEVQGHKIHIDASRNCNSLSCIKVSVPGLSGSGLGLKKDNDSTTPRTDPPPPKTVAAPVDTTPAKPVTAAIVPHVSETIGSISPTAAPAAPPAASTPKPAPVATAPVATPAPKPTTIAAAPATPVATPTTPVGVWSTEDGKGTVRIEACGNNLCGVAARTGEKILVNMKPLDTKWTGQIHDPDSGRTYDSSMTMKGPNTLRVQGCAFSGMFCGGQTWTRIS